MITSTITACSVLANSPVNKTAPASASEAGKTGERPEVPGFGDLLAREIGTEGDGSQGDPEQKAGGMGSGNGSLAEGSESGKSSVTVVKHHSPATEKAVEEDPDSLSNLPVPQFVHFANTLPNLITTQSRQALPEVAGFAETHNPLHAGVGQAAGSAVNTEDSHEADERGNATLVVPAQTLGSSNAQIAAVSSDPLPGAIAPSSVGTRAAATGASRFVTGVAEERAGRLSDVSAGIPDDMAAGARPVAIENTLQVHAEVDASKGWASAGGDKLRDVIASQLSSTEHIEKLADITTSSSTQNLSPTQVGGAILAGGNGLPASPSAGPVDHPSLLHTRVDSGGWSDALGQRVLWMVTQQQQTAELSLNPPDLGPLHVVLSIDNDQASVMFMSHNADVRQTLEAALPKLREVMADSGISLGSTTVSADTQQRGWADESGSGDHNGAPRIRGGGTSDPSGSSSRATTIGGRGLVDIFA
jgi:flagellar hook-length control protein FliK